jgi:hypothetical protein
MISPNVRRGTSGEKRKEPRTQESSLPRMHGSMPIYNKSIKIKMPPISWRQKKAEAIKPIKVLYA